MFRAAWGCFELRGPACAVSGNFLKNRIFVNSVRSFPRLDEGSCEYSMENNSVGHIRWWKVLLPVLLGLGFVAWMIARDFDPAIFEHVRFTWHALLFIAIAFLFMVGRDLGYMIRIRLFSRGQLTWRQAFRVIMLWEFTSAVTPSAIGGTSVAVVFVHKEGIPVGRSAAIVMLTSFFDELYFAVVFPIIFFLVGGDRLFDGPMGHELMLFASIGYGIKLAYLLLLSYGLFLNPIGLKWLIVKIFSLPGLRRWRPGAVKAGTDIVRSAIEIRRYRPMFWLKSFAATFLSWSSRYLVANALFLAFFSISDHLLVFARQLAMWIMMLVAPTPGGSGFAEYIFSNFLSDVIPVGASIQVGTAAVIALLWRLVTYYPYLIMGVFILPKWLGRSFGKKEPVVSQKAN